MKCKFCDKEIPVGAPLFQFRRCVRRDWPVVDGHGGSMNEFLETDDLGTWCEACEGDMRVISLERK